MSTTSRMRPFWPLAAGAWAAASFTLGVRAWSWTTGAPAPVSPFWCVALMVRGDLRPTAGMWAWVGAVAPPPGAGAAGPGAATRRPG